MRPVAQDHIALDPGQLVLDRFQQGHEGQVEEDEPVFRVVDDIFQLIVKQPRIDRMAHSPDAGNGEIELVVPVAVPGECGDPVAKLHAERLQRIAELFDPSMGIRIGIAVDRPFHRA